MERTFLTEKEVADWLHLSLPAIRRWRYEGRGPKFTKLSSAVRYAVSDVQSWIASRPTGGGR
jgi:predicted DNA-binding transcriptional regulator AlpA